jgi:Tol biopolymer transport system component
MTRAIGRAGIAALTSAALMACGGGTASGPSASSEAPTATSARGASAAPTMVADEPWIAYQWEQEGGGGIYLVRPDGTESHAVFSDVNYRTLHPDWSPGGAQIAFDAETSRGNEIWVVDADGTDAAAIVTRSTDCAISCGEVAEPAWSPDRSKLAFVRYQLGASGLEGAVIEVQDIASGDRRVLFRAPLKTALDDQRWSSDGQSIVFTMTRYPDTQINPGTATGSVIAVISVGEEDAKPLVLTDWSMFANYPDWRPGSDEIVFSTYGLGEFQATDEPSNLYTMKRDGSGLTALTSFGRAEQRATQPTWTPDGLRIIFTLVGQDAGFDNPRHAAFLDADGSNLVDTGITATHPRLRPGAR